MQASVCLCQVLKDVFNFHKYSSVTDMFVQLGLPSCATVRHNAELSGVLTGVKNTCMPSVVQPCVYNVHTSVCIYLLCEFCFFSVLHFY